MDASTKQGMELGEELQGKKVFDFVYMVTKDLPNTCLEKQFGVTNTELGWDDENLKQRYRRVPHVMLYWWILLDTTRTLLKCENPKSA